MNKINFSIKTLLFLFAIILIAGALLGYYLYLQSKEGIDSEANQSLVPPAETPFTDPLGNVIDLAQYNNKIRVVNSWASWTPFSKDELPLLNEIAKEYTDKGIVFLAINRMENLAYAQGYLNTLPELSALQVIFDPADNFFAKVDGYAMPETIVFDKQGNIVNHFRGQINPDDLRAELNNLLEAENQ